MKTERIYAHNIEYYFTDEPERELDEIDIEHIEECLKKDCNQGELCQCDNGMLYYGWWNIGR